MVDLFRAASRAAGGEEFYEDVVLDLTRFNTIEPILGFDRSGELILRYYDLIRPIGAVRNNPDYWLQYGIAATALDKLDRAGDAFENAYAREKKKRRPNTKKIDNYFSRYQLKLSASLADPVEAFELFTSATGLISKQIFMDDNRHYPFKSGRVYAEIATRHFDAWDQGMRARFVRETTAIRDKAMEFKSRSKVPSVDVDILISETSDLLKRIVAK